MLNVARLSLAVLLAILFFVRSAEADCDGRNYSGTMLLFPEDGADNIAVSSKIVASWPEGEVFLDGTLLQPIDLGVWDPGELSPGQTYVLQFRPQSAALPVLTHVFTVSSDVDSAPLSTPIIYDIKQYHWPQFDPDHAQELIRTCHYPIEDYCLDTCNTKTFILAATVDDDAVVHRVSSPDYSVLAYPGCGDELRLLACMVPHRRATCFHIESMSKGGSWVSGNEFCVENLCQITDDGCPPQAETAPNSPPPGENAGCSSTGSPSFPHSLLLLLSFFFFRRRARWPQHDQSSGMELSWNSRLGS
jgi:hypothetical protein